MFEENLKIEPIKDVSMSTEQKNNQGNDPPSPLIGFDLRLGNIKSTKNSFSRVLRFYARGLIEERTFKSLVWGLSQYTNVLKMYTEQDITERLEKLEASLKEE